MVELSTQLPPSFRAVRKNDWFNEQGKCRKKANKAVRALSKCVQFFARNNGQQCES